MFSFWQSEEAEKKNPGEDIPAPIECDLVDLV